VQYFLFHGVTLIRLIYHETESESVSITEVMNRALRMCFDAT
jgi:hypothetical protein